MRVNIHYHIGMNKVNIELNKLYSSNEVAEILNLTHAGVYKKIKKKEIVAHKIGHDFVIKGEDLHHYLNPSDLTDKKKEMIESIVKKVVKEYGEALRKLGKE